MSVSSSKKKKKNLSDNSCSLFATQLEVAQSEGAHREVRLHLKVKVVINIAMKVKVVINIVMKVKVVINIAMKVKVVIEIKMKMGQTEGEIFLHLVFKVQLKVKFGVTVKVDLN